MANIYNMIDTWNDGATTFTAIKMNVTDTASNANSLLLELQVGGSPKFKVSKAGTLCGSASNNFGTVYVNGAQTSFADAVIALGGPLAEGVTVRNNGFFAFSSVTSPAHANRDTALYRDAAGTLAQRNSTNAQTFRLYNTYTDASNYERGFMRFVSNVLEIGTEAAGTGTVRNLRLAGIVQIGTSNVTLSQISGGVYSGGVSINISGASRAILNGGIVLGSGQGFGWDSGSTPGTANDTNLYRAAAGIVGVRGANTSTGGALSFIEQTAPSAPAANGVYIYAEDNGSGKTRLMALFPTGAAQQIAIEP